MLLDFWILDRNCQKLEKWVTIGLPKWILSFLNGVPNILRGYLPSFPNRGILGYPISWKGDNFFLSCEIDFSGQDMFGAPEKTGGVDRLKIRPSVCILERKIFIYRHFQVRIQHSEDLLSIRIWPSIQVICYSKKNLP